MAELKTKETNASVEKYIDSVPADRKADAEKLLKLMRKISGEEGKMWGPSIVGFGKMHLKYKTGRELDWFPVGFSVRKANLTLYGMGGWDQDDLKKLGKHTLGVGCLYIKKLDDVSPEVLEDLVSKVSKNKELNV